MVMSEMQAIQPPSPTLPGCKVTSTSFEGQEARRLTDQTTGVGAEEAGPLDSFWSLRMVASGTGSYTSGAIAGARTQNKASGQVSGEKQDITGQECGRRMLGKKVQ